ncbi:MAG: 7-cyano-7-deazaguanine synthase QueC [Desulfovibrionaceae bacterium]|nr:7-cyano-7-deazaguanine synthase QueC [Desulfovibrionaceae bacterium]
MTAMTSALVLFSGGQDSTTCLIYALTRYERVLTIGFEYGQRHAAELACRQDILSEIARAPGKKWAPVTDLVVNLPDFSRLNADALTGSLAISEQPGALPTTFVPGRNLIFLTYAAAYAFGQGITDLVCGMGETDYSGYPDCREATLESMERSLSLGLDSPIRIVAPLMHRSKAETWKFAESLGGEWAVELIRVKTHTCYANERDHLHEYGYGCGVCPSCVLRKKGWEEYQAWKEKSTDPSVP